jgi:DNA-binding transcriptional LysR family regulator
MNQLQAMRVFTRVVELSSFNLAGKQLGMSAAAVTRSVGMLEAHLNVRLLNRSTRSLSLTEAGRVYLEGCRAVIEKLDEVESELVRAARDPSGVLRVAAPTVFAAGLAPLLATWRGLNPRVDFDVTLYDAPIDMIEGGFDVIFTTEHQTVNASLVSRHLTAVKEIAVASPAYVARCGVPRDPNALAKHDLLAVSNGTRVWEFQGPTGAHRVSVNSTLAATSGAMVRAAALADMGIAVLPMPFVVEDLARGLLVSVLDRYEINGGLQRISIVYSGRHYLTMKVRSFIDFAVEQYRGPIGSPSSDDAVSTAVANPGPGAVLRAVA